MDRTSDFLRAFQASLGAVPLPEAVARHYRLESCLAEGSQGSVWLLRRREDGERFVLRISREKDLREEFEAMRRLPGELAGQVPAAVGLFEEDGAQYLVRSWLPGRSLAEAWEAGERPEGQCVRLGRALCGLLDRLHRLSPPVIHRDVKPENIILAPDGTPGLIDFGIARGYAPGRDADTVCMGTRATAAPEQYGFSQSDQRTDLYALGVTLRWMVTGSYRPEELEAAECSDGMKRFLRKAAAFDPAGRYPTAAAMGAALKRLERPRRKRARTAALVCLLAVLLAAGAALADARRPVDFGSALLEEAVRAELGRPEGPVTRKDLERVRRLAVVGREPLGKEQDYQYRLCAYVDERQMLDDPPGDLADLSLLSEMPNLTTLYLCNQGLSDIAPLAGLPLRELYLCDNRIGDLSPLKRMASLEALYISGNPWTDLSPLSALKNLRRLNLDSWDFGRRIDSFAPLEGMKLEFLSAGNLLPADGDWSVLGRLERLETLWLWDPPDEALEALAASRSLRSLNLGNYRRPDLTELPVIPHLDELCIYSRLPSLEGVQKQEGLLQLSLCELPDMDLAPVRALRKLQYVWVSACPISDFSPLAELAGLLGVFMQEQNLASMEATCPQRGFAITIF